MIFRQEQHGRVPDRPGFVDAWIARIYGGATEIMKEIIGRSLDLSDPEPQTR